MRINLIVPYEDKDLAKKRGARWDVGGKVWYVENHPQLDLFLKWIPEHLQRPTQDKPLKRPKFQVVQPRTPRLNKRKKR